jgi:hypothetical protein
MHALREPIYAQFSRRQCAIFKYEMYTTWVEYGQQDDNASGGYRNEEGGTNTMCSGFRMAPCTVRTKKGDDIALVAFPEMHGFSELSNRSDQAYVAAKEFVSKTFPDSTGLDVGRARVERTRATNSGDGIIERHDRYCPRVDPQGQTLEEECVPSGIFPRGKTGSSILGVATGNPEFIAAHQKKCSQTSAGA